MVMASSSGRLLQRQNVRAEDLCLGPVGSSPSWSLQGSLPTAYHTLLLGHGSLWVSFGL